VNIRLYLDEDVMDASLIDALRARGVDLETVFEAGMAGGEDHEQLTYATKERRAVYSSNIGHFCRLHAEALAGGRNHAGIVLCQQQRYSVGEQMRRLLNLIAAKTAEEMHNQLEFLSNWP
jgi:DNA-binding transcriptional MerR regulator